MQTVLRAAFSQGSAAFLCQHQAELCQVGGAGACIVCCSAGSDLEIREGFWGCLIRGFVDEKGDSQHNDERDNPGSTHGFSALSCHVYNLSACIYLNMCVNCNH